MSTRHSKGTSVDECRRGVGEELEEEAGPDQIKHSYLVPTICEAPICEDWLCPSTY